MYETQISGGPGRTGLVPTTRGHRRRPRLGLGKHPG